MMSEKKYVISVAGGGGKGLQPPSSSQFVHRGVLATLTRERLFQTFLDLKLTFNILHIFFKKVERSVNGNFFTPHGIIHYLF